MTLLLLLGTILPAVTLVLLVAFFLTGAKNNALRYAAGAFGIASALIWIIKSAMR